MQTWTFGPGGIYTATWDGISKVTVTLTAGGAFVASFYAQSLNAAVASPEYQAILNPAPTSPLALSLVATTGVNGFALQNATPTILTWTAPNDGNMHRAIVIGAVNVTVAETGGQVNAVYTDVGGNAQNQVVGSAGLGTGVTTFNNAGRQLLLIKPGIALSVSQVSALTAGTAAVYAEIWAS
jgi:hypothetical protein